MGLHGFPLSVNPAHLLIKYHLFGARRGSVSQAQHVMYDASLTHLSDLSDPHTNDAFTHTQYYTIYPDHLLDDFHPLSTEPSLSQIVNSMGIMSKM